MLCVTFQAHLEKLLEPMSKVVKCFYGGQNDRMAFAPETGVWAGHEK